ncbi:hypothetical protein, partial [Bacillus cereus]|uniref:hypothetical protein n=1 Tax=Bacillus cereus TaxID=1396 RepID=UPI0028525645
ELTSECTVKLKEHSSYGVEPEVITSLEPDVKEREEKPKGNDYDYKNEKSVRASIEINENGVRNSEVALIIGEKVGTNQPIYWDDRRNIP